jgi:predicted acyltransferase
LAHEADSIFIKVYGNYIYSSFKTDLTQSILFPLSLLFYKMNEKSTSHRLLSLDTLRGFDMFWIAGGEEIFAVLAKVTGWSWAIFMAHQFTHPDWNGFRAYDLIFPTFLFMAGVSTPFSLGSRLEKGVPPSELIRKVIQRGIILVILGIIYNNGIFHTEWHNMRYPSVLARIGLAGMFAQIIYLYTSKKARWIWFASLLIGYYAFMVWFPVPGCGAGMLTMDCNPASYIDRMLIPGRLHLKIHDPEGLVSTIPAIATGLMGIFAGELLRTSEEVVSKNNKVVYLMAAGIVSLLLCLVWDFYFPINKNLWTSSFVLCAGGFSTLLLALFYWIIDVMHYRKWTFFFVVIGMNSIVIYMIGSYINFGYTAEALFGGILDFFPKPVAAVGEVIAFIMVQWSFMYLLYRNKLFLKV